MKNVFFALVLFSLSGLAAAVEVHSVSIETIRAFTSYQQEVRARNFTLFSVNKPLVGGCKSLFISSEDKEALSVLLMAKAQGTPVLVGYEEIIRAPWDGSLCAAVHIELS